MSETHSSVRWVDREAEAARLSDAILRRESLLICGPSQAGKTALVRRVLSLLPAATRRKCLYVSRPASLHQMLQELVAGLCRAENAHALRRLEVESGASPVLARRIAAQTSLQLKGILYRGLEEEGYWIFLDHVPPLSHAAANVLREFIWMRETPAYLVARGSRAAEIGLASRLYWNQAHWLPLAALAPSSAKQLLAACIRDFGLGAFDAADFGHTILEASGRLPGAIVEMCALAAQPRYRTADRIKADLVCIDYQLARRRAVSPRVSVRP